MYSKIPFEYGKEFISYYKRRFYHQIVFKNAPLFKKAYAERKDKDRFYRDLKGAYEQYAASSGGDPPPLNPIEYIIKTQLITMNMSVREFAEHIGLSEITIERFWTKPESRPKISSVIAVCIGLEFPPTTSEYVLALLGYHLRNIPPEDIYKALLTMYYKEGIR